jgi:predicted nucleic acid-binding protein
MKLAYVDTCVWVTRVEGLRKYQATIEEALDNLARDGWTFCVSDAVRLEALVNPLRKGQDDLVQIYQQLFDAARDLRMYVNVFKDALGIAQSERLKGMDTVHVALAVHHACQCFVTTDPHFRRLKAVVPHWIDLDRP